MKTLNNKKCNTPIIENLETAMGRKTHQFHIPGHTKGNAILKEFKRLIGKKVLNIDTTDAFEDIGTLNPPSGAINEAQILAAQAFGSKKTFFLLNGSTVGNLAIAMSMTKRGQKVILNRNSHRSIITGLIISGAEPLWLIPQKIDGWDIWGQVLAEDVEKLLKKNPDTKLVWITNPTYEGIVSNIKSISIVCKKYKVPLAVDEAHGCLWHFNKNLPESSLDAGADLIIHSLHKTGGSLSQSSMLHVGKNSSVDVENLEKTLKMLHTTSPSVLLLASLDAARAQLRSDKGIKLIKKAINNAVFFRNKLKKIPNIIALESSKNTPLDLTKIFVKSQNFSGKQLYEILKNEYNIEAESATDTGVLFLSNIGNSRKDFEYLINCLEKISYQGSLKQSKKYPENKKHMPMLIPQIQMNPQDAFYSEKESIKPINAVGKISAQLIAECPPGISILVPGEFITKNHLKYLEEYDKIDVVKQTKTRA